MFRKINFDQKFGMPSNNLEGQTLKAL